MEKYSAEGARNKPSQAKKKKLHKFRMLRKKT